jgi:hypothetical protein
VSRGFYTDDGVGVPEEEERVTGFWEAVGLDLLQHLRSIGIGSGALFVVFIHTMPRRPPESMVEYWEWVREALQTLLPIKRGLERLKRPKTKGAR